MLKTSRMIKTVGTFAVAAALATSALFATGCSGDTGSSSSTATASSSAASSSAAQTTAADQDLMSGTHHAVIEVEGYDPITVELDADAAPITVTNFVDLANDGYYDGLTFYRIVEDFCLQGGSAGNSAATINDGITPIIGEFSENGVDNPLADQFGRGTIAMARTNDPDSATSTFFVTLGDNSAVGASLDGKYAAFGTIDDAGMVTIDKIVADYVPSVDDPSMGTISDEASQAKIKSITITD